MALALIVTISLLYPASGIRVHASPPTSSNLNSLVILSPTDGWAVGDAGTILHFDGASWSPIPSGTTLNLYGISFGLPSMPNPSAGFAVGGSGGTATALFWNGVSWSSSTTGLSSPSAARLVSVSAVSSGDAWAVDVSSGAFWHWSGTPGLGGGWNAFSPATAGLTSVFMTSATEGWAVGIGGIIYHYASGGWTLFSTVGITLNSIFMLGTNEGWAVGNGGAIYHYSSGSWTGPVSPGSTNHNLKSIFMISQSEGWVVGASGTVLHFSDGVWTALAPNLLATNQNLNAVSFSGVAGWAVGDSGTVVGLGGQSSQGIPSASLQSVYLLSEGDGWIVGCSTGGCGSGAGEPTVAHWNGASFTRATVSAQPADLYSVFMVSSSDGWAVGGVGTSPVILHYTGGTWNQIPAPSTGYVLRSIFMVDAGNGWAVGDGGTILRYSGGSWGLMSSPTTNTLRSVFMLSAGEGWAVGDAGTILNHQALSGQWLKVGGPATGAPLNSVFLLDSSHGWAVGAGGTILHYDGAIWTTVADFVSTDLNSVFQVNPQEAWAVGDSATVLHWSGISWYPFTPSQPITGSPDLESVFLVSTGFGLIVGKPPSPGSQATILQIGQQTVSPIPESREPQILFVTVFMTMLIIVARLHKRPVRTKERISRTRGDS